MKWITSEKVKVDRVACPWLVRRFIDPAAEFEFLPQNTQSADIKDGILFDVPGCELGHHGEDVSFDSILKTYRLTEPALLLMADIVRAADLIHRIPSSGRRFTVDSPRLQHSGPY